MSSKEELDAKLINPRADANAFIDYVDDIEEDLCEGDILLRGRRAMLRLMEEVDNLRRNSK